MGKGVGGWVAAAAAVVGVGSGSAAAAATVVVEGGAMVMSAKVVGVGVMVVVVVVVGRRGTAAHNTKSTTQHTNAGGRPSSQTNHQGRGGCRRRARISRGRSERVNVVAGGVVGAEAAVVGVGVAGVAVAADLGAPAPFSGAHGRYGIYGSHAEGGLSLCACVCFCILFRVGRCEWGGREGVSGVL